MAEELALLERLLTPEQPFHQRRPLHELEAAGVAVAVGAESPELFADPPGVPHRVLRRVAAAEVTVHPPVLPLPKQPPSDPFAQIFKCVPCYHLTRGLASGNSLTCFGGRRTSRRSLSRRRPSWRSGASAPTGPPAK